MLRPVPGEAPGAADALPRAACDDSGRFTIAGVAAGKYTLVLHGATRQELYQELVTVAVDGAVPLIVRVGRKTATIASRESEPFRVPVGKGLKVQWKRYVEAAWLEHRIDIPPKCEMQLRIPSRKTMFIGTCR